MWYMSLIELSLLAIGLSMDVFSVCISNSLNYKNITIRKVFVIALVFSVFHGMMPIIWYFLWSLFMSFISAIDHRVAFGLLVYVGWEMIFDYFKQKKEKSEKQQSWDSLTIKTVLIQAFAISIDAVVVWLSFSAMDDINIWYSAMIIAVFCMIFSLWWFFVWKKLGLLFKDYAQLLGWVILVWIWMKILLEHLFMI